MDFKEQLDEVKALSGVTMVLANWKQYCETLKLNAGPPNPKEENCSCCVLDMGVRFNGWRKIVDGRIIGDPMTIPNSIRWLDINYYPMQKCADITDNGVHYDETSIKRYYRTHNM